MQKTDGHAFCADVKRYQQLHLLFCHIPPQKRGRNKKKEKLTEILFNLNSVMCENEESEIIFYASSYLLDSSQ